MDNYSKINTILVRLFNDILDYESKVFKNTEFKDITTNDMHIIDRCPGGDTSTGL